VVSSRAPCTCSQLDESHCSTLATSPCMTCAGTRDQLRRRRTLRRSLRRTSPLGARHETRICLFDVRHGPTVQRCRVQERSEELRRLATPVRRDLRISLLARISEPLGLQQGTGPLLAPMQRPSALADSFSPARRRDFREPHRRLQGDCHRGPLAPASRSCRCEAEEMMSVAGLAPTR
jgi:hypothetical protein